MRVLHIIDSGGLYGAETMLLHLAKAQQVQGIAPVICSIGEPLITQKELEGAAEALGIPVHRVRMRRGMNFPGALGILRFAKAGGFDLLHSHGYKGNILFGAVPAYVRNIPLVSTLHGWTAARAEGVLRLYEQMDRISLRFHNAVVAVSAHMLEDRRIASVVRRRITVIPNGIPVEVSAGMLAPEEVEDFAEFRRGVFTIGAIGRLSPEKAYHHLLEAVGVLCAEGRNIRLVIVGEGPERANLQAQTVRLKLQDRVWLAGYRRGAERYLGLFNVFVISSLTEGLPVSLLEAARARTPIVATSVGAIPDVLRDGQEALLVRPAEPGLLARAIARAMDDPGRASAMADCAYRAFATSYTSERMAEGYLSVYRRVLSCQGRQRQCPEPSNRHGPV